MSKTDSDSQKPQPSIQRRSNMAKVFGWGILIVAIVIGILIWNGGFNQLTLRFFGPPKVDLKESFSDKPNGETFDHAPLHQLLQDNVNLDGWVDYRRLKESEESQLDAYLNSIETATLEDLGRNERLAFLINAYNAFTLKLILQHYPLKSIKDIPDADRWDSVQWNLAGKIVSLSQIEHEYIRPNFKEPRIHFALVCAAAGCPPLSNNAYTGKNLEQQLTRQSLFVHQHATWFTYDVRQQKLGLTQLYNWYGDDFVQVSGAVKTFAANYSPELKKSMDSGASPRIHWLDYDWDLNDQSKEKPR